MFLTIDDICPNQYIDQSDSHRVSKLWVLTYCRGMTSIQVGKKKCDSDTQSRIYEECLIIIHIILWPFYFIYVYFCLWACLRWISFHNMNHIETPDWEVSANSTPLPNISLVNTFYLVILLTFFSWYSVSRYLDTVLKAVINILTHKSSLCSALILKSVFVVI